MKAILTLVAPAILLAACAGGGPLSRMSTSSTNAYWHSETDSVLEFRHDNVLCSNAAMKAGNVTTAPDNRMDRPPQRWSNSTAQRAYDSCMFDKGWRASS
jgi:hypothetical protein